MSIRRCLASLVLTALTAQCFVLQVQAEPPPPSVNKLAETAIDGDGQQLPRGAKYRLGTRNWRHRGEGFSLCFSPDGKSLALKSGYRDLFLMNAATGRVEFAGKPKLKDGSSLIATSLAFSPGGKELAFRSAAGPIEIFSADGRKHLRSQMVKLDRSFGMSARSLVYSPDGKYLAVMGEGDYAVFDTSTGVEAIREETKAQIQGVAFDRDSTQLYVASLNPSLKVWDLTKRKVVMTWSEAEPQFVRGPAIAPDGTTVAIGMKEVSVVDLKSDKVIHRLHGDSAEDLFMEVAITPDGKHVIGASQEGPVYVWNLSDGSRKWKLASDSSTVRSMALSPDGSQVATSDACHHIWIWSVETGKLLTDKAPGHDDSIDALAFSADGSMLVTGSRGRDTHIWNAASGQHLRKLATSSSSLAFTSEGNLLSCWMNSPPLHVWNVTSGELIRDMTPTGTGVGYFALSGDRKQVAILESAYAREGCRLLRLDSPSLTPRGEMTSPGYHVGCIAVSASGLFAAIAGAEAVEVWDLRNGKLLGTLHGHTHQPKGLAFTPDGRFLISGSLDQTVRVWELATCKPTFAMKGHKRSVAAITVAPNGRVVASAGGSRSYPIEVDDPHQIRFWDIATGEQVAALSGHNEDVSSLAFSPDGKLLAAGMRDTTALVWDVPAAAHVGGFSRQPLTDVEASKLWDELASPDANQAQNAIVRLAGDPRTAVSLAEKKLYSIVVPPAKEVEAVIQELDSDSFERREAAMTKLVAYGDTAAAYLRGAADKSESAEIQLRCKQILEKVGEKFNQSNPMLSQTRAVQLLEWCGTTEAVTFLKTLAGGASEAHQSKEAKAAPARLPK